MRGLLKNKLVHHDSSKYDGYRLTPLARARAVLGPGGSRPQRGAVLTPPRAPPPGL